MIKRGLNVLTYAKSQRIGILMLFAFLMLILSLNDYWNTPKKIILKDNSYHYKSNLNWLKPFNPNFLSDVKAYHIGMSVAEIDRLIAYRKQGKYVNSKEDFQKITKVSDSLLFIIAPYFKFPKLKKYKNYPRYSKKIVVIKDINTATAADLIQVYGIGEKRAQMILNYRTKLGGFVHNSQLSEVWGLNEEVLKELFKRFSVLSKPTFVCINVNQASIYELSKIPYLNYTLAKAILFYKREVAEIQSIEELKQIPDFPIQKFDIISLYLRAE